MNKKDEKTYTGIRLENSLREKAEKIGFGNLTEGVRKALIKYKIRKGGSGE